MSSGLDCDDKWTWVDLLSVFSPWCNVIDITRRNWPNTLNSLLVMNFNFHCTEIQLIISSHETIKLFLFPNEKKITRIKSKLFCWAMKNFSSHFPRENWVVSCSWREEEAWKYVMGHNFFSATRNSWKMRSKSCFHLSFTHNVTWNVDESYFCLNFFLIWYFKFYMSWHLELWMR